MKIIGEKLFEKSFSPNPFSKTFKRKNRQCFVQKQRTHLYVSQQKKESNPAVSNNLLHYFSTMYVSVVISNHPLNERGVQRTLPLAREIHKRLRAKASYAPSAQDIKLKNDRQVIFLPINSNEQFEPTRGIP
jgi:hypothetical protein